MYILHIHTHTFLWVGSSLHIRTSYILSVTPHQRPYMYGALNPKSNLPEIRGPLFGVPIIRMIAFWGLYWRPPIDGHYHTVRLIGPKYILFTYIALWVDLRTVQLVLNNG